MKTTIIALSAAALIVAAPAVPAQGVTSGTPAPRHEVAKKHHVSGHARPLALQAKGTGKGYPGASGYAPFEPKGYLDRDLEVSGRQAGGMGGM